MAEHSTIEWTDATWQAITGCTLVSEGCRHCYAARLAAGRLRHHPSRAGLARINAAGEAKFTGEVRFNAQWLDQPLRWIRPRRIFVCAHGDLFHESVPDEWLYDIFAVMALCSRHTFQVLTKRPDRMRAFCASEESLGHVLARAAHFLGPHGTISTNHHADGLAGLRLPNVWLGTSIEDQPTADARIPHLLATPAAVRFVSAEPLLGPVDLTEIPWLPDRPRFPETDDISDARSALHVIEKSRIDWVIVGGESGPGARPMHPDWVRDLRDQCAAAGVAYHHKQNGEWVSVSEVAGDGPHFTFDDGRTVRRIGKRHTGRTIDGVTHDAFPVLS